MKEVVHFTYDVEFCISTASQILIERILYNKKYKDEDSAILIKNKPYSIKELRFLYGSDKSDNSFTKEIVDIALKLYPQGTTLGLKHFQELAKIYIEQLATKHDANESYFIGSSGYVYDRNTHKKIYVEYCDHADAVIYLMIDFLGGPNKMKDAENIKDFICDYIQSYIEISSDVTSKKSVILDIRSEFVDLGFLERRYLEYKKNIDEYLSYLHKKRYIL